MFAAGNWETEAEGEPQASIVARGSAMVGGAVRGVGDCRKRRLWRKVNRDGTTSYGVHLLLCGMPPIDALFVIPFRPVNSR